MISYWSKDRKTDSRPSTLAHYAAMIAGNYSRRFMMGKYFIAWLLGVPLFVLVLIYLIF